uniref:Phosphoglycerate kinase n=1 Tax=Nicotiana tabacum TaxID=4097 RepID=A0A1S4BSW9_TOBAC|nr:PREDICTED: phosphoglycerate kinase, cytosolic-like [Nicotiana tabacum]
MANDCIGPDVEKMVHEILPGGVLLLENLRFHREEVRNETGFVIKLASLADLYVNDSFRTARGSYASTVGVPQYLKPAVAGLLMEKLLLTAKLDAFRNFAIFL